MVTQRILQRTFYIRSGYTAGGQGVGTAFTFEYNGIQYLATAKHTFHYAEPNMELEFSIMRNNEWLSINSKILNHPNNSVDIVVLTLPHDISPRHEINYGTNNLFLSQDAFFLGFPYGKFMEDITYANNGFPFPYVKKGIFSTIPFTHNDLELFYLDGLNNPGFSGGPCIFTPHGTEIHTICGVVKGYIPDEITIASPFGDYSFNANSGLVEVHSIKHLFEILS